MKRFIARARSAPSPGHFSPGEAFEVVCETEGAFFPILAGIRQDVAVAIVDRLERIEEAERRQAAA